jgi:hypothetical protein
MALRGRGGALPARAPPPPARALPGRSGRSERRARAAAAASISVLSLSRCRVSTRLDAELQGLTLNFQLKVSAFCGIGGAYRGCLGGFWGYKGVCWVCFCFRNGSG